MEKTPKQLKAKVLKNNPVMPGVFQLVLEAPDITAVAQPGQFVMLACGAENLLRRPIGINGADITTGQLSLLIMRTGTGTEWLGERQPGDIIDILGPLGNGFTINPAAKNLLLIAGGMGIAPLVFLAEKQNVTTTLVLGATTAAQLCPKELLPTEASCVLATEDGSAGQKGRVTDCLTGNIEKADQIFICGPLPMYRAFSKEPLLKGKDIQVSLEVRMACGLGVCYGCSIKTTSGMKQVCHDGPVFNMNEILWDELADI